jgi:hypothetical protein
MKRIVIICYDFPPLNSIGAQRPFSWYKHFKSFGLCPIIITNNWTNEKDVKNQILKEEEVHYVKSSKYTIEKLFSNRKKIGWVILRKIFSFSSGADIGINLLEDYNLSKKLASPNKLFEYIHSEMPVICSDTIENRKVFNKYK